MAKSNKSTANASAFVIPALASAAFTFAGAYQTMIDAMLAAEKSGVPREQMREDFMIGHIAKARGVGSVCFKTSKSASAVQPRQSPRSTTAGASAKKRGLIST